MIMRNYSIVFAIAAALIIGGVFVLLRNIGSDQDQQPQVEVQSDEVCVVDAECVLVQDGWCKTVLAVKKDKEAEWKQQNIQQTEAARQSRQTCKLMPPEYMRVENFKAVCEQSRCVAERVDNSIGIQDTTAVE